MEDSQTYAIIGAAMEVHGELGHGFLEAVYQEAMALELTLRDILYVREPNLSILYKTHTLKTTYRADFLVWNEIVVELKAQSAVTGVDQAQVINYLKATGYKRALLFNFGVASLQYHRLVL